jgi:hypothetical protein
MFENLMQNDGLTTAISGILIIFSGMVLIALVIHFFNTLFGAKEEDSAETTVEPTPAKMTSLLARHKEIPEDDLIAIACAVELYRRLHFDILESKVTFERGELHGGWKVGYKYGQRYHPVR